MFIDYEDVHRNSLRRQLNAEAERSQARQRKMVKQARKNAMIALMAFKKSNKAEKTIVKSVKKTAKRKISVKAVKYSKNIIGVTLPKPVKFVSSGFYTQKRYI